MFDKDESTNTYSQVGNSITNGGSGVAYDVSVSSDGSSVAFTVGRKVSVYFRSGDNWIARGNGHTTSYLAKAVSLNNDGTIVAFGRRYCSSCSGTAVKVLKWDGTSWNDYGRDLGSGGDFGEVGRLSLSGDGSAMAVGKTSGNSDGSVRVYRWEDDWVNKFSTSGSNYFVYPALSFDGEVLVCGTHGLGYLKVFNWDSDASTYVEVASTAGTSYYIGYALSLSSDGLMMSTGDSGFDSGSGRGFIYKLSSSTGNDNKLDYSLLFNSNENYPLVIQFNEGSTNNKEITFYYEISADKASEPFRQTIMSGNNCESNRSNDQADVTISHTMLGAISGKVPVKSEIDIDTTSIADNDYFYSTSTGSDGQLTAIISFCVRSDFGEIMYIDSNGSSATTSITFSMVKFSVTIDLEIGFESANVSVVEKEAGLVEEESSIVTNLSACACDIDDGMNCYSTDNAKTYTQNDLLEVCVYDPSEVANIIGFKNTYLEQIGIKSLIVDDDGKPSSIASIVSVGTPRAALSARIVSIFFDDTNIPVTMTGYAIIGFATIRKLSSYGKRVSSRHLQESSIDEYSQLTSFGTEVLLSNDTNQSKADVFICNHFNAIAMVIFALAMITSI